GVAELRNGFRIERGCPQVFIMRVSARLLRTHKRRTLVLPGEIAQPSPTRWYLVVGYGDDSAIDKRRPIIYIPFNVRDMGLRQRGSLIAKDGGEIQKPQ